VKLRKEVWKIQMGDEGDTGCRMGEITNNKRQIPNKVQPEADEPMAQIFKYLNRRVWNFKIVY
jgi:hypothetical protein